MATKTQKWAGIVLVITVLLSGGVLLLNDLIQQKVEEKIRTAIPGETVNFSSVDVSVLHSFIRVNNASVQFKEQPATVFFNKVEITGIHFWKWVTKKELVIDSVAVKEGTITYKDSLYKYNIVNVNAGGNRNIANLQIDSVRVVPLFGKEAFSRRLGHQADRINAVVTGINLKNAQTGALFKHELTAEELSVKNVSAFVFRDRRLPRELDRQPLPVRMVKNIPVRIRLNSLKVSNGSIAYEEYPKEGDHTGTLKIEHAKLSLTPFINHPLKTDPSHMILRSQGSLMGSGKIFTTMSLPLHSDNYYVNGAIENLELTKLNDASENLGNIHIESGLLDSLGFEFQFTEKKSTGKIIGIYHKLIIQPLKKKGDSKKVMKLKSFMLRHFIIPLNKDRSLSERKRTGKIDYTRDPTRKFSFYLLQSLLTGIKSSFKLGFLLPK